MCQEKEIEGIQIGKEDIKWSLFADDMIVYIEKKIPPPQIPWTNKYSSKISGYKINIKKVNSFAIYNNKQIKFGI